MFYKSSLLAVTVVLLAAGNALAVDVLPGAVLSHQSEVVTVSKVTKDLAGVKDRVEHSFDADFSVPAASLAVVEAAPVEFGAVNDLAEQLVLDNRVIAQVAEPFVLPKPPVDAAVLPVFIDQLKELDAAKPSSLELDLTKKWEINDAVALNEVLLTPPSERVALVAGKMVVVEPEPKKWAVSIHAQASTTGLIGADVGYKFSPNLHARLGLNTVGFSTTYASEGIDYKASFNPTNVHLLGDFFPFGGGLRLTGGVVFQGNQFNATGTPSGAGAQIVLGNNTYNTTDVGVVTSEGSFSNSVAPYLGMGFGTPLSPGLGFNLDAGVMFAGSPVVKLRANGAAPLLATQINQDLAEQERKTNNDISGFSVYPVISIGLSYAF